MQTFMQTPKFVLLGEHFPSVPRCEYDSRRVLTLIKVSCFNFFPRSFQATTLVARSCLKCIKCTQTVNVLFSFQVFPSSTSLSIYRHICCGRAAFGSSLGVIFSVPFHHGAGVSSIICSWIWSAAKLSTTVCCNWTCLGFGWASRSVSAIDNCKKWW